MILFFLIISLLFLLLIFHNAAINGTQNGLLLWYQTLIPSLLPFLLLTNALAETNAYHVFVSHFKKHKPRYIYELLAVILGNLCGYPIGGKIINDFVSNNHITEKKANRLLAFSSQASPMFLIGYVHLHILKGCIPLPVFLLSIYLPILLFLPYVCKNYKPADSDILYAAQKKLFICDTFIHTVETMVMIGMYVIIFSIILEIALPICQNDLSKISLSFLEITTGLNLLGKLNISSDLRTGIICALSAFGGLCSAFQIKEVLSYEHADIKKYLLTKIFLSAGTFSLIMLYLSLKN